MTQVSLLSLVSDKIDGWVSGNGLFRDVDLLNPVGNLSD